MTAHQFYYTHCTYGTSALDRATDVDANVPKGYGVRAGSQTGRELAEACKPFDPWLAYRLPAGTPGDEVVKAAPEQAPRTLLYLPQVGPFEAIGQISHRNFDSSNQRPGSFFAHVVYRERAEGPSWSPLEALRLYAAPGWRTRDAADLPHVLPKLDGWDAIAAGRAPLVDDAALLAFVKDSLSDGSPVVPHRWRQQSAQRRSGLLEDVIAGFLAVGVAPRRASLLGAEPPFAALLFYGVCRLLPPELTEGLSFSTYDSEPTRRRTTLAATLFRDPRTEDLPAEFYASDADYAFNTFTRKRGAVRGDPAYAALAVQALREEGFAGLDGLIARIRARGVRTGVDLNAVAAARRLVPLVLDPEAQTMEPVWRRSAFAARELADEVVAKLTAPDAEAHLTRIAGQAANLRALELLAAAPGEYPDSLLTRLARSLGDDQVGPAVTLPAVPEPAKIETVLAAAERSGRLPEAAQEFWSRGEIADRLTAKLPRPLLERVLAALPAARAPAFLSRTFASTDAAKRELARQALLWRFEAADDAGFCQLLLAEEGPDLVGRLADASPVIDRARAMLNALPDHLESLTKLKLWLAALTRIASRMSADGDRVSAWTDAVELTAAVAHRPDQDETRLVVRLGDRFEQAFGGRPSAARYDALRSLACLVLGNANEISADDWDMLEVFCTKGRVTLGDTFRKPRPKRRQSGKTGWLIAVGVALGLLVAGAVIGLIYWRR